MERECACALDQKRPASLIERVRVLFSLRAGCAGLSLRTQPPLLGIYCPDESWLSHSSYPLQHHSPSLSLFFLSVTFSCIPARRFRHELIRSSSSVCCCREMYTIAWPAERALSHPAHKVYLVACPPPVQHLGVVTLASSRPGDSRSTRPVVWCAACTVCVCACLSKWRRRAGYF